MTPNDLDAYLTVLSRVLPKPVGIAHARRTGTKAALLTFVLSALALELVVAPRTIVARVGLLVAMLAISVAVRNAVMEYTFKVDNWRANSQHMVLLHKWIPEYCKVIHSCMRPSLFSAIA